MPVVGMTGFEGGLQFSSASGSGRGFDGEKASGTGTVLIQNTVVRSGSYALSCDSTAGNSLSYLASNSYGSTVSNTTYYHRLYFQLNSLPSTATAQIFKPGSGLNVRVTSAGKLQFWDNSAVQRGSDGTTTVTTNKWHLLEVKIVVGASQTCTAIEIRLNGNSEVSASGSFGSYATLSCIFG